MSQMTATRAPARPLRRPTAAARPLRVVQGDLVAGQGWFLATCVALLAGGLLAVLILNTALAQGSFELGRLQATSSQLADQEEALTHSIDTQRAPSRLAQRAEQLGMVPAESPAFLRLSDGKVLGVATAAKAGDNFTVVVSPPRDRSSSPADDSWAQDGASASRSSVRVPVAPQESTPGGRADGGPSTGPTPAG